MEYKDVTDVIAGLRGALDWVERKAIRHGLSRLFWHSVNVQWYTPPVILATEWELDHPNRKSRVAILRYSWGRSLVLGFWGKKHYDEDHALLNATIHGRKRTDGENRGWDEESYREAEFAGSSLPLLNERPGLRVRATVDAGPDD